MSTCKNCGAQVGCGCQLKNGLCTYCQGKLSTAVNTNNNVVSQTN